VEPVGARTLPGYFQIAPAPPVGVLGDGRIDWRDGGRRVRAGVDDGVYGSDAMFPSSWGELVGGVQRLRRHRYVEIALNPVRYRPRSGELTVADALVIRISEVAQGGGEPDAFDDCRHEALAEELLENYADSLSWHGTACPSPAPPGAWDNMIIVTTNAIEDASDELDAYIAMREGQGREVTVATEDDWDVTTGGVQDGRPDRIRKWIADNHDDLQAAWVLLIGNPDPNGGVVDSIPMKYCATYDGTVAPTDYYYSNLSSDWDGNGDGTVCGANDNIGWTPDVYVGRIPIYSDGAAAADDILAKIIAYEDETESGDLEWRRRMMLPNSIYFFENQNGEETPRWDGATVGEYFIREEAGPRGMEWTTLYEHEGLAASQFESHFQVTAEEVVDQWHRGYGFVFWTGHGSDTGVYRSIWDEDNGDGYPSYQEMSSPNFMEAAYSYMLDDTPAPFVVHGSCSNGNPESANNLGYSLLRRGAIATVSASRSALTWHWPEIDPEIWEKPEVWNGDVIDIVTEYSTNLLDGEPAGKALEEAILATLNTQGLVSWYQKSIQNLYGDPLVRLVMCREDDECDNGLFCDGDELCDEGSCAPGEPVACEPTEECGEWLCDEAAAACVPSPAECPEPDAGPADTDSETADTDTGQPAPAEAAAVSSCAFAPGGGQGSRLLAGVLGALL